MAYRFDDFTLDPATRELRRDGGLVALPARAFDCLAYLLEHRERAVGRDELIAAVWGRADVSDALLNHTIVKLRRGLGDTGNEQRTIRTVPRFGYRWVGAVEVDAVDVAAAPPAAERAPAADAEAAPATDASALDSAPAVAAAEVAAPAAVPPRRQRRLAAAALAALAVIVLAAAALLAARRASPPAEVVDEAPPAAPVMVLPAEVSASEDWRWLRYGLMDLVANRLRAGAVPTAPSESVVGLLRQRAAESGDALLHDATLARSAALRVLPRVSAGADGWHVRLDAFGAQRAFSAEASAADAVQAARAAADRLLVQLGHARGAAAEELPPRLEALLEQSGAAMLADRLDEARALIVDAPPDLRGDPHLEQRLAQIDLRSGDYAAVETRLHALLDRLGPSRDATLRARAVLTLAAAYVRGDEPDKAADLYEEAIALRTPAADHEVLGIAHLGRSALYARQGRFGDATAEIARARVELETVGDALGVAGVDVNLGEAELMRHRPSDALPILKNAVREFERIGAREGRAYALAQQALAEDELLEVDAALATTERFWPAEQHTSNQRMRWQITRVRAAALAAVGRFDDAQALVERIRKGADPRADAIVRAQAELIGAALAKERGDYAGAAERAEAALGPALRVADPVVWTRGELLLARALRGRGRPDRAEDVVAALREAAAGDDWRTLYATLAAAEQAWAGRHREAALEQYAAAMQAAERLNVPEDLVAAGSAYLAALVDASQLDTARTVGGRIALWAERDLRAATAQARLFRALGEHDAAGKAEIAAARLAAERVAGPSGDL